jgi:hypothetical protein
MLGFADMLIILGGSVALALAVVLAGALFGKYKKP